MRVQKNLQDQIDVYVPDDGADTLCVYLHGGGWRLGDRTQGPGAAENWFFEAVAGLGIAIASVSYRKSFEALIGAAIDERPDLAAQASPVHHVRAGAPPFLFLHGTADLAVPPRQSERLAEALRAAGGEATVELIPGATHMFPELDDEATMTLIRRSVAFLRG